MPAARAMTSVPARARAEPVVGRGDVGARSGPAQAADGQRGPGVLRQQLDQADAQRRPDELAWAESKGALDAIAACFQGLAVDLGEQHALRERERPDRDRVVAERCRCDGRARRRRRTHATRHQRDADEQRRAASEQRCAYPSLRRTSAAHLRIPAAAAKGDNVSLVEPVMADRVASRRAATA